MGRIEHGVTVEAERESEEPFDAGIEFDSRRELVGFLAILVVVMAFAAATSVVLLPA
ncbi:MAG: hypothetical protein V5A62_17960 [Haloarculaceae archaeon]